MTLYYKLYKREHNGTWRYVDSSFDPEGEKIMKFLAFKLLKKAKERVETGPRWYVPDFKVVKAIEEDVEIIYGKVK